MIDVKTVRADPERFREVIRLRKVDPSKANLDKWLELDETRRQLQHALDQINAEKNKLSALGKSDPSLARTPSRLSAT